MKSFNKKNFLSKIYWICPRRHCLLLVSLILISAHLISRNNYTFNRNLSQKIIQPLHHFLAKLNSAFPFSVAELLIAAAVAGVSVYLIVSMIKLLVRPGKAVTLYRLLLTPAALAAAVYAGFCVLWGVYYYGEDFLNAGDFKQNEISVQQLEVVTKYFACLTNEYSLQVPRDERGACASSRQEIIEKSVEAYDAIEEEYPCLAGPRVAVKGVLCSKVMSLIDFTGFFFPFTAEANVNMDFPPALFASTAAHELAHQRGVAQEQEANFAAVLASLAYGDADYCYSACLLAYIHLGNALYQSDRDAWREVYGSLNSYVLQDLTDNSTYWAQFETPIQTVSNTVYEGFLQSYDQELGLKSYGACVDLLVNYYYETAQEYLTEISTIEAEESMP